MLTVAVTCIQGCSANKKGVGTLPKTNPFWNSSKLILKQNMKKVWESHSHAFPPHYTPCIASCERSFSKL